MRGIKSGPRPPLRFFVGSVGVAAVMIFIEKAARISSGGVNGLSLAVYGLTGVSVGLSNMLLKVVLLGITLGLGRRQYAMWNVVAIVVIGTSALAFEQIPITVVWPHWLAFMILVTVAYFPAGLVLSTGYSTGGFSAVAQAVEASRGIPLWITFVILNTLSVAAMFMVFGNVSGLYSLLATMWQGPAIQLWTRWIKRLWRDPGVNNAPTVIEKSPPA